MDHAFTRIGNRQYDLIGHLKPDPLGGDGDWIFVQRSGDRLPLHSHGRQFEFAFRALRAHGTVRLDRHSQLVEVAGTARFPGASQQRPTWLAAS